MSVGIHLHTWKDDNIVMTLSIMHPYIANDSVYS